MNLNQLTGTEVDRAHTATDYLLELGKKADILGPTLTAKLDTLRMDLKAEREDRLNLAKS